MTGMTIRGSLNLRQDLKAGDSIAILDALAKNDYDENDLVEGDFQKLDTSKLEVSTRLQNIVTCMQAPQSAADASSGEDEKYKNASSKVDENCKKFWLSLKMRSLLTSPAKTWSGTVKIQSLTRGITFPGSNTSQIMIRECFPQLEKAISRHFQKEETHPTTSQGGFISGDQFEGVKKPKYADDPSQMWAEQPLKRGGSEMGGFISGDQFEGVKKPKYADDPSQMWAEQPLKRGGSEMGEAMGISHDTEEDDELDELEEMEHTGKPGYFILKGMPGTGKTGFADYLICRIAESESSPTVVWQKAGKSPILFQGNDVYTSSMNEFPIAKALNDPDTWYIADSVAPMEVSAKTIVVTSPDKQIIKLADKKANNTYKVMPLWAESELIQTMLAFHGYRGREAQTIKAVKERFAKWGGIPRYVIEQLRDEDQSKLQKAINKCTLSQVVEGLESGTDSSCILHKIVHMTSNHDLSEGRTKIASPFVKEELVKRFLGLEAGDRRKYLADLESEDNIKSFKGYLWEDDTLQMIPKGLNGI